MHYISSVLAVAILGSMLGVLRFRSSWMRTIPMCSLLVLFFWSLMPVAWLTSATLEKGYAPGGPVDVADSGAIVVLSGSVLMPNASRPDPLLGHDTYLRCAHTAWIYKRHPLPVIATGSVIPTPSGPVVVARIMRDFLLAQGVSTVWTEERSSSTGENAVNTVQLLRAKGISKIVLVTEGYHMPRAEACFRKLGMQVLPAPCSMHTLDPLSWRSLIPDYRALKINEDNFHEWVGLLWYRMKGAV